MDADRDYLVTQLRRGPLEQAEEIIAARNGYCSQGSSPTGEVVVAAGEPDRDELSAAIEQLRGDFWDLPDDQLNARLRELDAHRYPELEIAVDRLRKIAELRPEFTRLRSDRHCDGPFLHYLRQIAVAPPSEAARWKETALGVPVDPHRLRRCQKMVRVMRRDFPRIFELQSDWLQHLLQLKARSSRAAQAPTTEQELAKAREHADAKLGCAVVILILFVLRVLVYVFYR